MATNVGLSVYKIYISDKHARDKWKMYRGQKQDGYALIEEALKSIHNQLRRVDDTKDADGNYIDNRAAKIIELTTDPSRAVIEGVLLKGEAGHIKDVYNLSEIDAIEPEFTISKDQVDLMPMYFRFHIEDGHNYGILMLQTYGIQGIKSYIDGLLNEVISEQTIKIKQMADEKILKQFAHLGMMQEIVLVNKGKSKTSKQAMEKYHVSTRVFDDDGDMMELRVHPKGGFTKLVMSKLLSLVKNKDDLAKIINVPMTKYDDVYVEIMYGKRKQKFSLLNPDDSPIRFSINDKIKNGENGYPTLASLKTAADYVWKSVSVILGHEV